MMVQETKRQAQEFLSQPDAAARLAWLERFQKAATTAEFPETSTEEESSLIALAFALKAEVKFVMRDDPPGAQEIVLLIQEVATWSGEPEIQAIADWSWGNAHIYEGHFKACLSRYEEALYYYESTDQQVEIVDLHINCAGACSSMDAYEEALLHLEKAQNKIDSHTDSDAAIDLEVTLAVTYGYLDRYEEAIAATKRGIALAQENGLPAQEGRLLINQSLALEGRGHFDEAVVALEQAQQILAAHDEKFDEGTAWVNLGMVQTRRGEYRQALLDLDHARRRYEALDNAMAVAMVDFRRAQTSLELNLLSETIALCEASQPILQAQHDVQRYGIAAGYYLGIAYSPRSCSEFSSC